MTAFNAASWIDFFNTAGLSEASYKYAHIFIENRIQTDMLVDLNKEYLREMGITLMGDIIAILRHAKQVHEKTSRERVLSIEAKVPKVAAITAHQSIATVTAPAKARIVQPEAKSQISSLPVVAPKIRRVLPEHEGRYKIILPSGSTQRSKEILAKKAMLHSDTDYKKTNIFQRLGAEEDTEMNPNSQVIKITGLSKSTPSSVFTRLGDKSDSDSQNMDTSFSGVIKTNTKTTTPSVSQKVILVQKRPAKAATMIADEYKMERMDVREQLKAVSFSSEDEIVEIAPRRLVVKPRIQKINIGGKPNPVKTRLGMKLNAKKGNIIQLTKTTNFKVDRPKNLVASKLKADQLLMLNKQSVHNRLNMKKISALNESKLATRIGKVSLVSTKKMTPRLQINKSVFNRLG